MDGWIRFAAQRKKHFIWASALAAMFMAMLLARGAMPKTYIITDGDRVVTLSTFATDPAQVLGEAGLELREHDSYSTGGDQIHISRGARVVVWLYGRMRVLSAQGETVEQLLERFGLEPGPEDRLSHPLETEVWDGMELRIDRVWSRQEVYTTTVSHQVIFCDDPTLPAGVREVLVPGSDGELLRRAQVTYTNNQETSRVILAETMTLAPVTEIVAVGTGTEVAARETGLRITDGFIYLPTGEVLTYHDTAQVLATAYTHTDEGCDMITYTGTTVRIGTVAVDPRYIPYGTRMFIVSNDGCYVYGISVAEDCGGAIKGERIDLYFPTYDECIQFGRRDCTIYFLG